MPKTLLLTKNKGVNVNIIYLNVEKYRKNHQTQVKFIYILMKISDFVEMRGKQLFTF